MSRSLRNNLFVSEKIRKLHHSSDTFVIKSFLSVLLLQLSRHLRDNLLSILRTLAPKYISVNALTNMPVHHSQLVVSCSSYMTTSLIDYLAQVFHQ